MDNVFDGGFGGLPDQHMFRLNTWLSLEMMGLAVC